MGSSARYPARDNPETGTPGALRERYSQESETMREGIHPEYKETRFMCACGNKFTAMSTLGGEHHMEICSACHPFFTGKEKLVDTAGQIEKFHRRYAKKSPAQSA